MLKDIIYEKWKEAFKARDIVKKSIYEAIKQRILLAEKSGNYELPLSDEIVTNLIIKECKEREETIQFYKPEDDMYKNLLTQIDILKEYLPKQLSEEEVIEIIKRFKATESNTGKVIGLVIKEVGNSFDKSKIAALVKNC